MDISHRSVWYWAHQTFERPALLYTVARIEMSTLGSVVIPRYTAPPSTKEDRTLGFCPKNFAVTELIVFCSWVCRSSNSRLRTVRHTRGPSPACFTSARCHEGYWILLYHQSWIQSISSRMVNCLFYLPVSPWWQNNRVFDIADAAFSQVSDEEKLRFVGDVAKTGTYEGYKLQNYWVNSIVFLWSEAINWPYHLLSISIMAFKTRLSIITVHDSYLRIR